MKGNLIKKIEEHFNIPEFLKEFIKDNFSMADTEFSRCIDHNIYGLGGRSVYNTKICIPPKNDTKIYYKSEEVIMVIKKTDLDQAKEFFTLNNSEMRNVVCYITNRLPFGVKVFKKHKKKY